MFKEIASFAATKWGHVVFATVAYAAPLVFTAIGVSEPAAVQVVLNMLGAGALARGYAGFLDIVNFERKST